MGKAADTEKERIFTMLFICLIAMNLLSSSMAQMNTAGSPLLVSATGGPTAYGGFLVTAFVIASIPARMISGPLADKRSRKIVLMTGSIVYLAGSALAAFVPTLEALLPARVLQGMGYAAVHTAASTCASDVLPRERLGEGIGYYGLGHALAMSVGPMLAIDLVGTGWFPALAAGAGLLSAIVLALSFAITYEKHPERLPRTSGYRQRVEAKRLNARCADTSFQKNAGCANTANGKPDARDTSLPSSPTGSVQALDALSANSITEGTDISPKPDVCRLVAWLSGLFDPAALRGGIPMFLISGCIVFFISFATLFAQNEGYEHPGALFVLASATAIVVRFTASRTLDRFAPLPVFLIPISAGALALAGAYFVRLEWAFALCGIGYGVCLGFAIPLLSSIAVKLTPPKRWGAANALFFLCYDIGIGAGAVAWGALLDCFGFDAVFLASGLSLVASLASAAALFPKGA